MAFAHPWLSRMRRSGQASALDASAQAAAEAECQTAAKNRQGAGNGFAADLPDNLSLHGLIEIIEAGRWCNESIGCFHIIDVPLLQADLAAEDGQAIDLDAHCSGSITGCSGGNGSAGGILVLRAVPRDINDTGPLIIVGLQCCYRSIDSTGYAGGAALELSKAADCQGECISIGRRFQQGPTDKGRGSLGGCTPLA